MLFVLVRMRSQMPMVAEAAGTKLPVCAMYTIRPTCLRYTVLPTQVAKETEMSAVEARDVKEGECEQWSSVRAL
jgi:hypothetical protein